MQLAPKFIGVLPNEETPAIALYTIDARGAAKKVVALAKGSLDLGDQPARRISGIIAIGPDVPDPGTLRDAPGA